MPGTEPDLTREFIARLAPTPAQTVASWSGLGDRALDVDWAQLSTLAIQHRVEGLLAEASEAVGIDDQLPPSALSTLRRRAELAEARQRALSAAFQTLAATRSFPTRDLVVYKGLSLVHLYDTPRHRMVSDLDLLIAPAALPTLRQSFAAAGYRERATPSGPAFLGPAASPQIGCDFVAFDLHLDPLPRFRRPRDAPRVDWIESANAFEFAGVECRTLAPDVALLIALVYLGEHAVSWIRACLEDDVRLIKVFDVELLCTSTRVEAQALLHRARDLRLEGSLALGLAVILSTRGRLPTALSPLVGIAELVTDLLDRVALPGGSVTRWPRPFAVRVFESDKSVEALKRMPAGRQHRRIWHNASSGPNTAAEDVAAITTVARARVMAGSSHSPEDPEHEP